jgi:hypothetical protein
VSSLLPGPAIPPLFWTFFFGRNESGKSSFRTSTTRDKYS